MKITEEMVEKVAQVWAGDLWDDLTEGSVYSSMPTKYHFRDKARAAIEAVAPLIVEECARVVEQRQLPEERYGIQAPDFWLGAFDAGKDIAAILRALAKEPAQ